MNELMDAQLMHKKYPETFEVPTSLELYDLKLGDIVQVSNSLERFWVIITGIKGDTLSGVVDNNTETYSCNQGIDFEKKNIYKIYSE